MVFRQQRHKRTHRRDKLFITQLIKRVYQLIAYMNVTIYPKIYYITKNLREIHFSMICSVFIYNCVFWPNPNTMSITHYHLSWGTSKNILENATTIFEYLDFKSVPVIIMKCSYYYRYTYNLYLQFRHTQKPSY